MLIYELYKVCIKDGYDELINYFEFVFFGFLILPIDILLIPFELLAFIIYKIRRTKK